MSERAEIRKLNNAYYRQMLYLTRSERSLRAEIATETEIALISLLNYMQAEYRKSLDDFIRNYGNFSDQLNVIYNRADDMAFSSKSSPYMPSTDKGMSDLHII